VVRRREHGGGAHGVRILLLSERAQRRRLILGDRGRVAQPTLAEDLKSHTAFESPAAPQQGAELIARRPHLMARDLVGDHQHSCRLIGQFYVWRRLTDGAQTDDGIELGVELVEESRVIARRARAWRLEDRGLVLLLDVRHDVCGRSR